MAGKEEELGPDDPGDEMKPRRQDRNGFRTHGQKREEWTPTAYQWAIYDAVRRGMSLRSAGAKYEVSFQYVHQVCQKVDQYLSQFYIDRVREIRVRHTEQLEHIFTEAMAAWERSKEDAVTSIQGETTKSFKTETKTVSQAGAPAFLNEARGALADIRKIHAVDKNPKMADTDGNEDADRVAGKTREQIIQERINRLNASLKTSQAMNGSSEQAG